MALTLNEPNLARLLPLVMPPHFLDGLRANLAAAARAANVPRFMVANTVPPEDVPAVTTGMIRGHRLARAAIKAVRPDVLEKIIATIPIKRLGTPEEIASVVAWLAGEESGFTTGADFSCNGGLHMG